jgi:hypothetical protein
VVSYFYLNCKGLLSQCFVDTTAFGPEKEFLWVGMASLLTYYPVLYIRVLFSLSLCSMPVNIQQVKGNYYQHYCEQNG